MITVEQFSAFSQEEQIERLQKLGEAALREFEVRPIRMEPLVHAENTTFRVDADQGTFNLRISRPGYQTTSNIQSELVLLRALRDAGFRVPSPHQDRLVTAAADVVPEPRDCVLFRWMGGDFRREVLLPKEAALVGRTMARMHDFAVSWEPPDGFDRQQLHEWAFGPEEATALHEPSPLVSEEDRTMLVEIYSQSRTMLQGLPRDSDSFGLIHSDMHVGNLLFEDGHLNVIDFDDTGWGFWLYDFSAALSYQVSKPNYRENRDAFFQAYEEVRPLPPRTFELLVPFLRMRLTGIAKWVLSRPDNPYFREHGHAFICRLCDGVRKAEAAG